MKRPVEIRISITTENWTIDVLDDSGKHLHSMKIKVNVDGEEYRDDDGVDFQDIFGETDLAEQLEDFVLAPFHLYQALERYNDQYERGEDYKEDEEDWIHPADISNT